MKKLNNYSFIEKAKKIHGDKYDYSLVNYINSRTKVKIICKEHGVFEQIPASHLRGYSCLLCSQKIPKHCSNRNEFIEKAKKIHGDKYDYSLVDYIGTYNKVKIICKKCNNIFKQRPNDHLQFHGCSRCLKMGVSDDEKKLVDFIKDNYKYEIIENSKQIISPYEIDIYLPDLKLAFEYNGLYWHSELEKDQNYHLNKTELCERKRIHLIQIYEDDWIYKQDIVKSRILNLLGKSNRIYARNCIIKESDFKTAKYFLECNHLQGFVNSKINIGLYYDNELISLMTFGNLRKNLGQTSQEGYYELLRFCNKLNYTVIGGANKLFNYFVDKYKPTKTISYADRSWTMNNGKTLYDKLGFKFSGVTKPNYSYIVDGMRKNRFKFRKDVLVKEGYDSSKSEHEIMFERGYYRIYDSGNLRYELKFLITL